MSELHISKVSISNYLGIESYTFEAGAFTLIEGQNGSGKTSIMEAIKSVFEGGSDATLLRKGQDKGEVVLLLSDGTEIKRRQTSTGVNVTVEKDGVRAPSPQSVIKALADTISVNPVEFLKMGDTPAGKRQRMNLLLEALPMQVDQERLVAMAGKAAEAADPERPALEQLAAVHKAIFDDRTYTNRAFKEKEGAISQLAATLPETDPDAPQGDLTALEAQLAEADAKKEGKIAEISGKLEEYRTASAERMKAMQDELSDVQRRMAKEELWMSETAGKANAFRQSALTAHAEARAPIIAAIAGLRDGASAVAKAVQTRETIKTLRTEADALEEDSKAQTAALAALVSYKAELLASLPISGLTVREGEIYRDDVPFDRLNKAQQVDIAVEIAKLRAGRLGIICVDELESLDPEHLEAFKAKSLESDYQLIVTRVAPGPLTVTSENS